MAETILHRRQRASPSGYVGTQRGTICGGDADWYRIGMDPNDGLSLTLRSEDGEPVDAYLFAAGSERGQPVLRAADASDRLDYAQGTTAFVPGGDWYPLGHRSWPRNQRNL